MDRSGVLLVLSGPSGAGKTTVYRRALADMPEVRFSVSCTTRAPRPGEAEGRDYYFLAPEEFRRRERAGAFLEWAEVHGNLYGTLRSEVDEHVAAGRDVLLDVDVQGARLIRKAVTATSLEGPSVFVFVGPPSLAELERRLRGRGTDTEESIRTRLSGARAEMRAWAEYDNLVINDDVDRAVRELESIVRAAHCRTACFRRVWDDV